MIADRPGDCLSIFVQTGNQFRRRIDFFGAFGAPGLADLGACPGGFHASSLGRIVTLSAIRWSGHCSALAETGFASPPQCEGTGARVPFPDHFVFGDELVRSHVNRSRRSRVATHQHTIGDLLCTCRWLPDLLLSWRCRSVGHHLGVLRWWQTFRVLRR